MVTENKLFEELDLGGMTLPHRVIMAPLTRSRAAQPGHVPTEMNAEYYRQRASAALIISEATQISQQGMGYAYTPGIYTDEQVSGWQKVTDAVHKEGGKIFLQLWHVGRISHSSLQPNGDLPVAPSAIQPEGTAFTYDGFHPFETPRALETKELAGVVEQYRHAAKNAKRAGFDGVEIHAANGYLLDQFLRDGTNQRTDRYGGSVENRARLVLEVVKAVTQVWDSQQVGIRISPLGKFNSMSDSNPKQTFSYLAEQLNQYNLAYLHIVEKIFGEEPDPSIEFDLDILGKIFNGVFIGNGGYTKELAEKRIAQGKVDAVAFGTLFISNPDLPERLRKKEVLNEADPETFYGGDEKGYTDYPTLTQ